MKTTQPSTIVPLLAFLLALAFTSSAADRKPNVIVIYSDDQGTVDLGCYGSKDLETPHLDKLAARGVRFTQMYSPSAICSASRAGLLTGRFPARAGVPGNVSSQKGKPGMPAEEVTIAEMMKAAGYATGHIGKWHLGYTPETMPNAQGFDYSFGHMGGCIDNYSHFFYWNGPNRHDLWRNGEEIWEDGVFFGDSMVREAKGFIEKNKEKPFFVYWAINFPHYPLQGKEKWRKRYAHLESPRRMYNAFVSTMDEMIGEVLGKVDELGLREDTLVIFQSDHGHSTEERTFFGGRQSGALSRGQGLPVRGRHPRAVDRLAAWAHPAGRSARPDGRRLRLAADHRGDRRRGKAEPQAGRTEHCPKMIQSGKRAESAQGGVLLAAWRRQGRPMGGSRGKLEAARQSQGPQRHGAPSAQTTNCFSWTWPPTSRS